MNKIFEFLLITIFLASCIGNNEKLVKFSGEAQGTYYAVTYYEKDGANYQNEIEALLDEFDHSVSLWVANSVLSKVNNNDSTVELDDIFVNTFNLSKEIYKETTGAFDPTIGPLVNAWGFGFSDRMKIDQPLVDSLLLLIGFDKVNIVDGHVEKSDSRIQFDFNAIAQGYSVDLIGQFLINKGITKFLVDIGGEVLSKGKKPNGEFWKVGIEKPEDNAAYGQDLKAIINLENKALATSGNYRKFYKEDGVRYSHTIDPNTGYPVQHSILSVSVLADECAIADGYATGFMVLGLNMAKKIIENQEGIEVYFIYSDENGILKTAYTEGFKKIIQKEME